MMESVLRIRSKGENSTDGRVILDIPKMFWNLGMLVSAIIFAPLTISLESVLLFIVLTYFSLLIGHSAGMHRLMIHRTYQCNKLVERILIYIGVLVGMSGPFGIIKIHDVRDWAQRQKNCHPFFSHDKNYLQDIWWQLTSKFLFKHPPKVNIESHYSDDKFYKFLERTWRLHQIGLAIILYLIGGWSFVVWGILVRISVSIVGHWTITYFCHNPGQGKWRVKNVSVQASNIPGLGLITYGECWHNNHHAFPESAKIGLEKGQYDPAWWFIKTLGKLGIVHNIKMPRGKEKQDDLEEIC